jgi:hypothetical protein
MKTTILIMAATAQLLLGCASTAPDYGPTLDVGAAQKPGLQADLAACRAIASQAPEADGALAARRGAVRSGLLTAAGYGVLTVATGGLGAVAALPAMAGSIAGTAGSAAFVGGASAKTTAAARYKGIVGACLKGRGHPVLD